LLLEIPTKRAYQMKVTIKKILHDQTGQTFFIVLMIMFVALTVGVTVSSRFIKSLHSIVATDDATKALGVAEAAIERLLLKSSDTLLGYINNNNCGSDCTLTITDVTGQRLTADVVLSIVGNTTDSYELSVAKGETGAINLTGYTSGRTVYACWNGTSSLTGLYIYSQSGVIKATPFSYNAVLAYDTTNGFSNSSANFGFANCFSVQAIQTPLSVRFQSIYDRTDITVLPEAGYSLPVQGIQLVSTGRAGPAQKKVTVIKSTSYSPTYFDYALYQKSYDDSLSN
jgi:hypothetical protein